LNFYERIIDELNNRKKVVVCICPDCEYKTNMEYESSRSSYLEEWYRCSICKNTFQPNYLGAWNKLRCFDILENMR
jgi:hypothetical protein